MKKAWYTAGALFVVAVLVSAIFSANRIQDKRRQEEIAKEDRRQGRVAGGSAMEAEPLKETDGQEDLETSTGNAAVTTKQTQFCVEIYKKNTGELEVGTYALPSELVGKSKEEISGLLKLFQKGPGEEELKKGFVNAELLSFSEKRIVIRKNYIDESEEFVLLPSEGKIVVFEKDGKTIFTITDIPLDVLSEEQKKEIEAGKRIRSLAELYDFLEAFSS